MWTASLDTSAKSGALPNRSQLPVCSQPSCFAFFLANSETKMNQQQMRGAKKLLLVRARLWLLLLFQYEP